MVPWLFFSFFFIFFINKQNCTFKRDSYKNGESERRKQTTFLTSAEFTERLETLVIHWENWKVTFAQGVTPPSTPAPPAPTLHRYLSSCGRGCQGSANAAVHINSNTLAITA